ncbi:TITAN-like protein [Linum grandiflorum]
MKATEKKTKKKAEFEFCKVCKLNHDHGNRHKYFPNHTKSLAAFLSRFQTKLSDIRFFLRNPCLLQPQLASRNRFWCVFCDADVDEIGSSFACANAINHLASADHIKKLKNFLWKYGGGMDRVDSFRFSEADLAKWEKNCESLKEDGASSCRVGLQIGPSNDIQNGLSYKSINEFENNVLDPLTSNLDINVMPLQYNTSEYQISQSGFGLSPEVSRVVCNANSFEHGNSSDPTGWQNSHHYTPHNGTNNLVNGGVSFIYYCIQGERFLMCLSIYAEILSFLIFSKYLACRW